MWTGTILNPERKSYRFKKYPDAGGRRVIDITDLTHVRW